jgi:inosose dehydratase
VPLDDAQWARLTARLDTVAELAAGHGLTLAVHPHWDTLVESAADVQRLLATSAVPWCLDTGHLLIGGVDPADFVADHGDRIAHVHLKDVDSRVAARLRAGDLTLVQATQAGLFRPLGEGDARVETVIRRLERQGYERWLVLEQDTAITGEEPPVGRGPVVDVATCIDFLNTLALDEEEERVV